MKLLHRSFQYLLKNKYLLLVLIPAFLLYMAVIVPSGTNFCYFGNCGYHFWGVHDHDGLWNIAIAQVSFPHIPPLAPTFSGGLLRGYNHLLDFLLYLVKVIIRIPPIITYFKLLPVAWFFLHSLLLITLARSYQKNKVYVLFFLLIALFASPYVALFTLYHSHTIWNSANLLSTSIVHTMTNLHFALSLLLHSSLLIYLRAKSKQINAKVVFVLAIMTFLLYGLKFYAGSAVMVLITLYLLVGKISITQKIHYLALYILLATIGVVYWYQPDGSAGSVFILSPFAIFNKITEEPNLFYLKDLTNARYYLESIGIGPRLLGIYSLNTGLYLFFSLGVRFFGLLYLVYQGLRKKLSPFDFCIAATIVFTILIPTFFIQRDDWWNTMQFYDIAIFYLTIYSAELFTNIWNKRKNILRLGIAILIVLSLFPALDIVRIYVFSPPRKSISLEEADVLYFLSRSQRGIVHVESDPEFYRDTAYVTALSGQMTYLQNPHMVGNTQIDYHPRAEQIKNNPCQTLKNISYLYVAGNQGRLLKKYDSCEGNLLSEIYSRDNISLYEIQKKQ